MVTDKEVATALGWGCVETLLYARENKNESDLIKSAVRKKWCNSSRCVTLCYEIDRAELSLWHYDGHDSLTVVDESELDCWKEALVWLDKKEKKDA